MRRPQAACSPGPPRRRDDRRLFLGRLLVVQRRHLERGLAAAVCSSVTELQSSVADLQSVPVVQEGVGALEDAFATVRSDVAQVVDDGKAQFRSQTEGLSADLTAVQTAVSAATSTPTAATLSAVVDVDRHPGGRRRRRSPTTSPRPADARRRPTRSAGPAALSLRANRAARRTRPAPLVAARRHGATPSISVSREKLRTVLISTMPPRTATLSSVVSTATVRTRSAATRTSSPSRMTPPKDSRSAR